MIGTKKRSVSSDGAKVTKKPKLEKLNDAPAPKLAKKNFSPKANDGGVDDKKGKFQKKLAPGGKKDGFRKDYKDKSVEEKKPFVENTPESKREYWNSLKAKQKELRDQRRKSKTKDLYELSVGAKKIYETLKR